MRPYRSVPRAVALALLAALPLVLPSAAQDDGKAAPPYSAELVAQVVADARKAGDARQGAAVFRAPQYACLGCHRVGREGGTVGPDLTLVGRCLTPEQIVESVLWPARQVKDEFKAIRAITADGIVHQGYKER